MAATKTATLKLARVDEENGCEACWDALRAPLDTATEAWLWIHGDLGYVYGRVEACSETRTGGRWIEVWIEVRS